MNFMNESCIEFIDKLSSAAPTPGGGGGSAYVGAVGMALGNMVGSLTIGKKKYADVQEDIITLNDKAKKLQENLIELVRRDAEVFEPLSKAYSLPKDTPQQQEHKDKIMEDALVECCLVPMEIMECCCKAIQLHKEYAEKGTAIAISDVGVGVACCNAALKGASLNVFINTKFMKNRTVAQEFNEKAEGLLKEFCPMADEIFDDVQRRFI